LAGNRGLRGSAASPVHILFVDRRLWIVAENDLFAEVPMRTVFLILRLLLGLVFFVFGLNGFLHFIPNQPMPSAAMNFFGALAGTGYMIKLIFTTQVVGGALLLIGVAVPFALTILAPVIVNIFFFHLYLAPEGLPIAIVVCLIEIILAWSRRASFGPLFA
jgi:putative oxidoreductase